MIFTQMGNEVTIDAYCGKHPAPWNSRASVVLVRVRYSDDRTRFLWMGQLKADDGLKEIEAATAAAPHVTLTDDEFEKAIEEAGT